MYYDNKKQKSELIESIQLDMNTLSDHINMSNKHTLYMKILDLIYIIIIKAIGSSIRSRGSILCAYIITKHDSVVSKPLKFSIKCRGGGDNDGSNGYGDGSSGGAGHR